MGDLILCRTRLAAMPYYIENISLNIYSLEELCYYIENNSDRLDDSFWCEELFSWLVEELKCADLVTELRKKKRDGAEVAELVLLTVNACGYIDKGHKKGILEELRELEHKSDFQKGKLRADRHLKNRRYVISILEYKKLLRLLEKEPLQAVEIGSIYHNLGVANAQMFLYEQAAECFEKAYEYNNNPESMTEMYFALQCISTKENVANYEPPLEWREVVMTRVQQAVNELELESSGVPTVESLAEWKKKLRMYSKI